MTNIEMKLKSREQLSMEILTLQQRLMLKDKEIERLNNIIDKAIEYINNHIICYCPGENEHYEFDYITTSPKELLNILEGEDNE